MNEQEFAQRLRQYRKNKGMTQQELADQLGVSNKTVSRWESGSYPDVTTLVALARVLGVTVDELLDPKTSVRTLEKSDWQNLLSYCLCHWRRIAVLPAGPVCAASPVLGIVSGLPGLRNLSPGSLHLPYSLVSTGGVGDGVFCKLVGGGDAAFRGWGCAGSCLDGDLAGEFLVRAGDGNQHWRCSITLAGIFSHLDRTDDSPKLLDGIFSP